MTGVLLPQGGGTLAIADWLAVVDADYLRDFLPSGGAAVKLVVAGSAGTAAEVAAGLRRSAAAAGLAVAEIDAASTRVHLVDQVFAAVSRQLDWRGSPRGWLVRGYRGLGLDLADGDLVAVAAVAEQADLDPRQLQLDLRRRLEQTLLADATLPRDLRAALLRVAHGEAAFTGTNAQDVEAALAWLHADPVPAAVLRRLGLSARINRSSARPLLVGLGRALGGGIDTSGPHASAAGALRGLVVVLDGDRLAVARRPPAEDRDGFYYSKAAVLDAWEVLRQLIDATEAMAGMLVVVVVPPELVTDPGRGLPSYSALQLRVADEVRDRRRANPFAALVRVDVRLEAVR